MIHLLGYIDPGTGSTVIQVVIAGLATAGYLVKVFWKNIRTFATKIIPRPSNEKD